MTSELPYEVANDWPVVELRDVTTKIGSGATPRGGSSSYLVNRDRFAFVRSQNVFDRHFDTSSLAFISDAQAAALRGVELLPNDILLNITGDGVTFGRAAMIEKVALPACVNQHVSIIRADRAKALPGYLLAYLTHPAVKLYIASFNAGGSRRAVTKKNIESFCLPLPPLEVQADIAATLGMLDDKIESNRRQKKLLRSLGNAKYSRATLTRGRDIALKEVTLSIAQGVSPKYVDDDLTAPLVINQRCIRDGWVTLSSARRMQNRVVKSAKCASGGDILVNSTGTGTLGRLSRWHEGEIFVDSHVTVVKPDPEVVPPTVLAYSLLDRQADIEMLATGSTGQTELSVTRLGELTIRLPDSQTAIDLEDELLTIENMAMHLTRETSCLEGLRNSLLPELLSGRIRVFTEG